MIKEEAIEILSDMRAEYNFFSDDEEEATRYHALSWAIQALNEQQPEQKWIPCSERLPEEFGEYLVTKKAIGWNCEEYNSNDIAYFDNEGFHKADKVIAWMPLPEPWKGEEDGGSN